MRLTAELQTLQYPEAGIQGMKKNKTTTHIYLICSKNFGLGSNQQPDQITIVMTSRHDRVRLSAFNFIFNNYFNREHIPGFRWRLFHFFLKLCYLYFLPHLLHSKCQYQ